MTDDAAPARIEQRVLILGAGGMLGHMLLRVLAKSESLSAWGTLRRDAAALFMPAGLQERLLTSVEALNEVSIVRALDEVRPDVVINCVGLIKQRPDGQDPEQAIAVNALLPHRLARLSRSRGARFIHVSTDCVFSGATGLYGETSLPDCTDIYGRSKLLGEVVDHGALTLRTSIIGPELEQGFGLLAWFLSQQGRIRGFRQAIFSGLPTVSFARLIRDYVLPRPGLAGLYHVSTAPISKYDLLLLLREAWGTDIDIVPDDEVAIDRSLDSSRFRAETGYRPAVWPELVAEMRAFG